MKNKTVLTHEFVEFIPDDPLEGTLYVSMRFATVVHKCCCGCGTEVVTPLSPMDWKLIFDGKTISLEPSIGNWSLECQSHYWIRGNQVRWARQWSQEEINDVRAYDKYARNNYYSRNSEVSSNISESAHLNGNAKPTIMKRLKKLLGWLKS